MNPFLVWFLVKTDRIIYADDDLKVPIVYYLPLVIIIEHFTFFWAFFVSKLITKKGTWVTNQEKMEEFHQTQDQEKQNSKEIVRLENEKIFGMVNSFYLDHSPKPNKKKDY